MVDRPPRILLVVGPATGGIGAHAASLAAGIAEKGAVVALVCPELTAERFSWEVPVVRAWPGGGPLELWRRWRRLRELVATADVVHAHGHQAGLLALAAARGARPRPAVVVSWHNAVLAGGPRRALLSVGERLQARRAELVTGASLDLVERARRLGAGAAELAPVASPRAGERVPEGARERVRAALGLEPEAHLAVTVSRIAPQKRLDVLLDAAGLLARTEAERRLGGPVTWLLAGDGDRGLEEQLRRRVEREGLDVRFLGARRDVAELLAAADVFVLTSRWEARALVVQEALAAGTPVVATAVGGLPELVDGAGMLVREGDALGVATAVGEVLSDARLHARLVEAGRRRFAEQPSETDITRSWWTRYARLARAAHGLR